MRFGKNSDREPNEAQYLFHTPAQEHPPRQPHTMHLHDHSASTARSRRAAFAPVLEWAPWQVVVSAQGGHLTGGNAEIGPWLGAKGRVLTSMFLYREHHTTVSTASPMSPCPPAAYPDALIPFRDSSSSPLDGALYDAAPFDLPDGNNQPLWDGCVHSLCSRHRHLPSNLYRHR